MIKKHFEKFWSIACLLTLASSLLTLIIPPVLTAAAPASGQWIDQTHISYNGQTFADDQLDDTWEYYDGNHSSKNGTNSACNDKIYKFDGGEIKNDGSTIEKNPTGAVYVERHTDPATGACVESAPQHITLDGVSDAEADLDLTDANTITAITGDTYVKNGTDGLFYEKGGDNCKDTLQINTVGTPGAVGTATLIIRTASGNTSFDDQNLWLNYLMKGNQVDENSAKTVDGCEVFKALTVPVSNFANVNPQDVTNPGTATTSSDGSSSDSSVDCETSGNSLSWIMCPIITGLASAVDGIYGDFVQPLLVTRTLDVTNSGNDPTHTYEIWSKFRVIGDVFLVVALIAIVFGQTIGGGVIDAYTAKKVLPRLLIAAIAINLSIYLVALAVDITNILGNGAAGLIELPFKQAGAFTLHLNGGTSGLGLFALVTGTIWAASNVVPLLIFFFTAVLLPVFFIFLAILVTVIIRRGLIIFLVLISPVAFALYCLPNTEKYFKQWWDLLVKTLMVYPIIAIMFALGNVISVTINTASTSSGISDTVAQLISIVALVIPLGLIPFSFKLAGGILGRVHDLAQGGAAKLNGMHEGRRANARARLQRSMAGNRAKRLNQINGSVVGKAINKTPVASYAFGRALQSADQRNRMLSGELAKDPRAATIQHYDDALRAATYDNYLQAVSGVKQKLMADNPNMSEAEATQKAQAAARAVQTSTGFGRASAVWAAEQMSITGTAYSDMNDVMQTIARASGGNRTTLASLAGNINSTTKQARPDLAPGYGTLAQGALEALDNGGQVTQGTLDTAELNATRGMDMVSILRGKPQDVKNITGTLQKNLESNYKTMTDPTASRADKEKALMEVKRTIGQIKQLDANRSYASTDNQQTVNELAETTQPLIDQIQGKNVPRDIPDVDREGNPVMNSDGSPRLRRVIERTPGLVDTLSRNRDDVRAHLDDIERFSAPMRYDPNSPNAGQAGPGGGAGGAPDH